MRDARCAMRDALDFSVRRMAQGALRKAL